MLLWSFQLTLFVKGVGKPDTPWLLRLNYQFLTYWLFLNIQWMYLNHHSGCFLACCLLPPWPPENGSNWKICCSALGISISALNDETKIKTDIEKVWVSMTRPKPRLKRFVSQWKDREILGLNEDTKTETETVSVLITRPRMKIFESPSQDWDWNFLSLSDGSETETEILWVSKTRKISNSGELFLM